MNKKKYNTRKPYVSVVIASYNRKNYICRCIAALINQKNVKKGYEIIIVDDGSIDGTKEFLKKIKNVNIKYVFQKHLGAAKARNIGIKKSRGQIIAFTDDDCIPYKYWIADICLNFERYKDADSFVNKTLAVYNGYFESLNSIEEKTFLTNNCIAAKFTNPDPLTSRVITDNCAIKKNVLKAVGYFDDTFKNAAGEDVDLGIKLAKKGYNTYWVNNMKVYHYQRNNIKDIWKRYKLFGIADARNYSDHFRNYIYVYPGFGMFRIFRKSIITVRIEGSFFNVILGITILGIFFPIISVILLFLFLLNKFLDIRDLDKTIKFTVFGIVSGAAWTTGHIIGGFKNKILCI